MDRQNQQPYRGHIQPTNLNGTFPIQSHDNRTNVQSRPRTYSKKMAKAFGAIQIIIGVICLAFNIFLIAAHRGYYNLHLVGYGIWGGAIYFAAGVLSCILGSKQTKCLITSTMVMEIIAACAAAAIVILGIMDAHQAGIEKYLEEYAYKLYLNLNYQDMRFLNKGFYYSKEEASLNIRFYETNIILAIIIVSLSVLEAVISITGSAFSCRTVCCTTSKHASGVPNGVTTNQQIYLPNSPMATAPFVIQNQSNDPYNFYSQYYGE